MRDRHVSRDTTLCFVLFGVLIALLAVILRHLPLWPQPSDDIFYIDAAWNLARGTYQPPTPNAPFHHYLRWPVILPLAAIIRFGGLAPWSYTAFVGLHLVGIVGATFALVYRLERSFTLGAAAAFAVLLIPIGVLPPLVRSEWPALFWALIAFNLVILRPQRRKRLSLLAAGAALAVSMNAAQISLFSAAPVALVLLWRVREGTETLRALVGAAAMVALGGAAMLLSTMAIEGVLFGDPLIQLHAMQWWHFKLTAGEGRWAGFFEAQDEQRFMLGLLVRMMREAPLLSLLLLGSSAVALLVPSGLRSERILVASFWAGALSVDLLGAPFVQKLYLRFLVVPIFCVAAAVPVLAVRLMMAERRHLPLGVGLLLGVGICIAPNTRVSVLHDGWVEYYKHPLDVIVTDIRRRGASAQQLTVFTERDGAKYLIPWQLAGPVYSGGVINSDVFVVSKLPSGEANGLEYVLLDSGSTSSPGRGFEPLPYSLKATGPRPTVWVRFPGEI